MNPFGQQEVFTVAIISFYRVSVLMVAYVMGGTDRVTVTKIKKWCGRKFGDYDLGDRPNIDSLCDPKAKSTETWG